MDATELKCEEGKARRSSLELAMLQQLMAMRLHDGMTQEHRFHETRKWRLDFAWPDEQLALEVEGGVYSGGRHTRGYGFEQDATKYAEALLAGWRVLRATGAQVKSGQAAEWVARARGRNIIPD